jgi:ABC-type antimicrobial peptide transport system permease subunit
MNVKLLEGRDFSKDSHNDRNESVIVSETFVRNFGLEENAVGTRLLLADSLQLYIIGVVPDILTDGFWKPAAPVMLRYVAPNQYTQIVVSTSAANLLSVNDFMVETWKKISPNTLYNGKHVDSNLYVAQLINTNAVRICLFLGVIAALMSATALYALVSLNILKKRKELGVRKVLGASMGNIIRVINIEFIIILAFASVLGSVAGYYLTDKGMDAIWEHYLPIDVTTLAICVGLLIIIAMVTVGYKTISTARINPVESLREE